MYGTLNRRETQVFLLAKRTSCANPMSRKRQSQVQSVKYYEKLWADCGKVFRQTILFLLAVCLCDHVASSISYLIHVTDTACFSFKRDRLSRPGRARGGHHLLQEGTFELVAEAAVRSRNAASLDRKCSRSRSRTRDLIP